MLQKIICNKLYYQRDGRHEEAIENDLATMVQDTQDRIVRDRYDDRRSLPYHYMVEYERFRRALDYVSHLFVPRLYSSLKAAGVPENDIRHIIMADGRDLFDSSRSIWHWLPLMTDSVSPLKYYDEGDAMLSDDSYVAMPYTVLINEDPYVLAEELLDVMQSGRADAKTISLEIDPMEKRIIRLRTLDVDVDADADILPTNSSSTTAAC